MREVWVCLRLLAACASEQKDSWPLQPFSWAALNHSVRRSWCAAGCQSHSCRLASGLPHLATRNRLMYTTLDHAGLSVQACENHLIKCTALWSKQALDGCPERRVCCRSQQKFSVQKEEVWLAQNSGFQNWSNIWKSAKTQWLDVLFWNPIG